MNSSDRVTITKLSSRIHDLAFSSLVKTIFFCFFKLAEAKRAARLASKYFNLAQHDMYWEINDDHKNCNNVFLLLVSINSTKIGHSGGP